MPGGWRGLLWRVFSPTSRCSGCACPEFHTAHLRRGWAWRLHVQTWLARGAG
jgi:hypothetical protein